MGNQFGGSRTDTVVKLVLIFFISLLSFSVGTYVGKGVSETEYARHALENGPYAQHKNAASTGSHTDGQESLSDEDIASLTDEFVNSEKAKMDHSEQRKVASTDHPGQGHAKKTEHHDKMDKAHKTKEGYSKMTGQKGQKAEDDPKFKPPTKKAHKPKVMHNTATRPPTKKTHHGKTSTPADRVSNGKAPIKDPIKKRKPTSVYPSVASSSIGKYTVQVASYTNQSEAKNHAATLKGQGYSAFYVPALVKGRTWYRVSVGLFTNHKSAMYFRKEIMKKAKIDSAIVQKIIR